MRMLFLAGVAASLMSAAPLIAQDGGEGVAIEDPYLLFAQTMSPEEIYDLSFEATMVQLAAAYTNDSDIAAMEAECPGSVSAMVEGTRDLMRKAHREEGRALLEAATRIARSRFDEAEIREITSFFANPLGQKMLFNAAANVEASQSFNDVVSNDDSSIGQAAFEADRQSHVEKTVQAMSAADIAELERFFAGKPWLVDLQAFSSDMATEKLRIINLPLDPADDAAIAERTEVALTAHLATCEAVAP